MRTLKIVYKIVLVLAIIILSTSSICFAAVTTPDADMTGGGTTTTITGEGLPTLDDGYKPVPSLGTDSEGKVEIILGALTVVGIVVTLIGIALIGFNMLADSASEKAINQEKIVGIVIAALLIAGSSTIARIIINFAENAI